MGLRPQTQGRASPLTPVFGNSLISDPNPAPWFHKHQFCSPAPFLSQDSCRERALGGASCHARVICPHWSWQPLVPDSQTPEGLFALPAWGPFTSVPHLSNRVLGTGGSKTRTPSPASPHRGPEESPYGPRCFIDPASPGHLARKGDLSSAIPSPFPFVLLGAWAFGGKVPKTHRHLLLQSQSNARGPALP